MPDDMAREFCEAMGWDSPEDLRAATLFAWKVRAAALCDAVRIMGGKPA